MSGGWGEVFAAPEIIRFVQLGDTMDEVAAFCDMIRLQVDSDSAPYLYKEIPCKLDSIVEDFVIRAAKQNDILAEIDTHGSSSFVGFILQAYSVRMASLTVRTRSVTHFSDAVLSLACAAELLYWKENVAAFYILKDCADRCGFRVVSEIGKLADWFRVIRLFSDSFPDDIPLPHTLAEIGARAIDNEEGFRYDLI